MIYKFENFIPVVHPGAFVHPQATIIGNVVIEDKVYIGPGAVLRGDWGGIWIEEGCNVQENCVVHMFPGVQVRLRKGAHIGHGAIIHGAEIGENSLVGMNAVLMDRVTVGKGCIIGALAFVAADTKIPDRKVVVGNPAKVVKDVSDEMLNWKTEGTRLYQELPAQMKESLELVEPRREIPNNQTLQDSVYRTWNEKKIK
jgi:phenylacetic acid degradation protein